MHRTGVGLGVGVGFGAGGFGAGVGVGVGAGFGFGRGFDGVVPPASPPSASGAASAVAAGVGVGVAVGRVVDVGLGDAAGVDALPGAAAGTPPTQAVSASAVTAPRRRTGRERRAGCFADGVRMEAFDVVAGRGRSRHAGRHRGGDRGGAG
ncbi:hypothetical protein [Microbacterium sp. GXF7504]